MAMKLLIIPLFAILTIATCKPVTDKTELPHSREFYAGYIKAITDNFDQLFETDRQVRSTKDEDDKPKEEKRVLLNTDAKTSFIKKQLSTPRTNRKKKSRRRHKVVHLEKILQRRSETMKMGGLVINPTSYVDERSDHFIHQAEKFNLISKRHRDTLESIFGIYHRQPVLLRSEAGRVMHNRFADLEWPSIGNVEVYPIFENRNWNMNQREIGFVPLSPNYLNKNRLYPFDIQTVKPMIPLRQPKRPNILYRAVLPIPVPYFGPARYVHPSIPAATPLAGFIPFSLNLIKARRLAMLPSRRTNIGSKNTTCCQPCKDSILLNATGQAILNNITVARNVTSSGNCTCNSGKTEANNSTCNACCNDNGDNDDDDDEDDGDENCCCCGNGCHVHHTTWTTHHMHHHNYTHHHHTTHVCPTFHHCMCEHVHKFQHPSKTKTEHVKDCSSCHVHDTPCCSSCPNKLANGYICPVGDGILVNDHKNIGYNHPYLNNQIHHPNNPNGPLFGWGDYFGDFQELREIENMKMAERLLENQQQIDPIINHPSINSVLNHIYRNNAVQVSNAPGSGVGLAKGYGIPAPPMFTNNNIAQDMAVQRMVIPILPFAYPL